MQDKGEYDHIRESSQEKLNKLEGLIEKGANVNAKNNKGQTPLHHAVKTGNTKTVQYLIQKGANVNAKNNKGQTPLHDATKLDRLKIAEHLIQKGADTKIKNKDGKNPIDKIEEIRDEKKMLLKKGMISKVELNEIEENIDNIKRVAKNIHTKTIESSVQNRRNAEVDAVQGKILQTRSTEGSHPEEKKAGHH